MKKMCPHRKKYLFGDCPFPKVYGEGCPKNTNPRCEIITKNSKKPKTRKVPGYAWVINGKVIEVSTSKVGAWYGHIKPCTITIAEKYLKNTKGNK